jgi:hypothetical protein
MSTMKNAIGGSILFAAMALGLGGCGPVVPDRPTWQHDIRPLMVARCIRCHNDPGGVDPLTANAVPAWGAKPPLVLLYNFDFVTLPNPVPQQLTALQALGPKSVRGSPHIMPPPPAEKLEDWEIQLLDNWAAEKPPL